MKDHLGTHLAPITVLTKMECEVAREFSSSREMDPSMMELGRTTTCVDTDD